MEWYELRNILAKSRRIRYEQCPEYGYARISIDLGAAEYVGTDIPLAFSGDHLTKIEYTGGKTSTYFRLNDKHAQQIYASEFKESTIPFIDIYLTNPIAQTGKILSFYISTGITASIKPSIDIVRVKPGIKNSVDMLTGVSTNSADTIPAPAAGHALEIYAFSLTYTMNAPTGVSGQYKLGGLTSGTYLYYEAGGADSLKVAKTMALSGLKVQLEESEALTLGNITFTGGSSKVYCSVFYTDVRL